MLFYRFQRGFFFTHFVIKELTKSKFSFALDILTVHRIQARGHDCNRHGAMSSMPYGHVTRWRTESAKLRVKVKAPITTGRGTNTVVGIATTLWLWEPQHCSQERVVVATIRLRKGNNSNEKRYKHCGCKSHNTVAKSAWLWQLFRLHVRTHVKVVSTKNSVEATIFYTTRKF